LGDDRNFLFSNGSSSWLFELRLYTIGVSLEHFKGIKTLTLLDFLDSKDLDW
jgi:hypothetical protein